MLICVICSKVRPDFDLHGNSQMELEISPLGIPTDKVMPGEKYLPKFKFFVSGFSTSPFGVEWMRFEPDSPIPELIKTVPHLVFEVDNLDKELAKNNFEIFAGPTIELMEFTK